MCICIYIYIWKKEKKKKERIVFYKIRCSEYAIWLTIWSMHIAIYQKTEGRKGKVLRAQVEKINSYALFGTEGSIE